MDTGWSDGGWADLLAYAVMEDHNTRGTGDPQSQARSGPKGAGPGGPARRKRAVKGSIWTALFQAIQEAGEDR